jgi:hypothetical protein
MPAFGLRHASNVHAVDVEEIEGVEDGVAGHLLSAAAAQRLLKGAEVRSALLVENNRLPVQDQRGNVQSLRRRRNAGKTMRPVVAATGQDPDASRLDVNG